MMMIGKRGEVQRGGVPSGGGASWVFMAPAGMGCGGGCDEADAGLKRNNG